MVVHLSCEKKQLSRMRLCWQPGHSFGEKQCLLSFPSAHCTQHTVTRECQASFQALGRRTNMLQQEIFQPTRTARNQALLFEALTSSAHRRSMRAPSQNVWYLKTHTHRATAEVVHRQGQAPYLIAQVTKRCQSSIPPKLLCLPFLQVCRTGLWIRTQQLVLDRKSYTNLITRLCQLYALLDAREERKALHVAEEHQEILQASTTHLMYVCMAVSLQVCTHVCRLMQMHTRLMHILTVRPLVEKGGGLCHA